MCELTIPDNLAACADLYEDIRNRRLELSKEVDALTKQENEVKRHLISELRKVEATGIAGKRVRVAVVEKEEPSVTNWDEFYAYIAETKSFDLLNRAVNRASVKERWVDGVQVPGMNKVTVFSLSRSAIRSKP